MESTPGQPCVAQLEFCMPRVAPLPRSSIDRLAAMILPPRAGDHQFRIAMHRLVPRSILIHIALFFGLESRTSVRE